MRLILASSSPRRAELLSAAGFSFDVLPVDVDERVIDGESPADYVCRLASEKSKRAFEISRAKNRAHVKGNPANHLRQDSGGQEAGSHVAVLGADTAVVVDGQILGKPRDDADAQRMLHLLEGRSHEVLTGISIRSSEEELGALETTSVWFAPLTDADVAWYINTGDGRDKAGAYAIQGLASRFIPRISGSYSNVVGLPVALVAALLNRLKSG